MQMVLKTTTTPVDGESTTTTETLNFTYDASGMPMSVKYDNTTYYYVVNIQGDIMAILNTSGEVVVEYTYDAWGNIHSVTGSLADSLGEVNPLTYRGYVYDQEIGMFYLQSRYYDPEVGRFINADDISYLGADGTLQSNNLFAYCKNNPTNLFDKSGEFGISLALIGIVAGAVVGAVAGAITAYSVAKEKGVDGKELAAKTALGAVAGAAVGGALGAGGAALVTKLTGIVGISITGGKVLAVKAVTLLGSIPGYVEAARRIGAGCFNIPEEAYKAMSEAQQWATNAQYIDDAIALGSKFVVYAEKVVKTTSVLWNEINQLIERGIAWTMY